VEGIVIRLERAQREFAFTLRFQGVEAFGQLRKNIAFYFHDAHLSFRLNEFSIQCR
jgi:hypothetical protein